MDEIRKLDTLHSEHWIQNLNFLNKYTLKNTDFYKKKEIDMPGEVVSTDAKQSMSTNLREFGIAYREQVSV